jgi:hypothetical protein
VGREEYKDARDFYWSADSVMGKQDGEVFFQRRYSEPDLLERIVRPSGLRIMRIGYFGERVNLGEAEVSRYLPPLTGPIQPLASRIFQRGPENSWREIPNPLGALLVLQKGDSLRRQELEI